MSVPTSSSAVSTSNAAVKHKSGRNQKSRQWNIKGGRSGIPDAADMKSVDTYIATSRKDSTLSVPDLLAKLHETLALELKYQPNIDLPKKPQHGNEITVGARHGAAVVLRFIQAWYELPADMLFTSLNLVDRFLTKMRVKPRHMACINVGSCTLAMAQLGFINVNVDDIVVVSQCRCSSGEIRRMAAIIADKLGVQMNVAPITSLTFLRIFYYLFKNRAIEVGLKDFFESELNLKEAELRLEAVVCDASCASIRLSELALVLMCTYLDIHITQLFERVLTPPIQALVDYAIELKNLCKIPESTFFETHTIIIDVFNRKNNVSRQELVWKLSSRTMRVLRPTDRFTHCLPTIEEDNGASKKPNINNNINSERLRNVSTSSEEGEDWPTSPTIPVYEECEASEDVVMK